MAANARRDKTGRGTRAYLSADMLAGKFTAPSMWKSRQCHRVREIKWGRTFR